MNFKCPVCDNQLNADHKAMLLSEPPKMRVWCNHCDYVGFREYNITEVMETSRRNLQNDINEASSSFIKTIFWMLVLLLIISLFSEE